MSERDAELCGVVLITSLTLSPGEAIGTHTSVGSDAAPSVQAAIFTNSCRGKETPVKHRHCHSHNAMDISGSHRSGVVSVLLTIVSNGPDNIAATKPTVAIGGDGDSFLG